MVKKDKIMKGHKAMKNLDAGVHTNLELLREALNKICEENSFEKPKELEELNILFNSENE